MPLLGREPDTQVFRDIRENPADQTYEGITVLRIDGGLFFATAEALENRIRSLVGSDVRTLVLDLEGVNFVDSQGSAKLAEIHGFLETDGVEFRVARVKPRVLAVLEADGVVDLIGADHIHGNVHRAVEAALRTRSRHRSSSSSPISSSERLLSSSSTSGVPPARPTPSRCRGGGRHLMIGRPSLYGEPTGRRTPWPEPFRRS